MPRKISRNRSRKAAGKRKGGNTRRILMATGIVLLVSLLIPFGYFYGKAFRSNLTLGGEKNGWIYIRTTDTFHDVLEQLTTRRMLRNRESFVWMAEFLDYDHNVKPGRYKVHEGMSNRQLLMLLRSGRQEPIRLTLHNIRTREQLAGKIGQLLEADSLSVLEQLNDHEVMGRYGLTPAAAMSLFLPDTYEFYWNTPSDRFIVKMGEEFLRFWNEERKKKAAAQHLTPAEVHILASIVQQESNLQREWPLIAGVYLNRLRKGMKLQADPTVKFAAGDFTLRRVRGAVLNIDSPYNTYRYAGLPPGPIYMASKTCIDSVLHVRTHSYLYFCARPDGSGTHAFASTYEQHQQNARDYQRALNRRGI